MALVFVQFRCIPGKTYEVATAIYDREVVSELYSTSGEYDLIAKVYIPEGQDVGRYLAEGLKGSGASLMQAAAVPVGLACTGAGYIVMTTQLRRGSATPLNELV